VVLRATFITHHNSLDMLLYTRTNELFKKDWLLADLMAYGFRKTSKRNGSYAQPWIYCHGNICTYKDYNWMMKFTENLLNIARC
jgi:lysyl-tRNA synthetase class 2